MIKFIKSFFKKKEDPVAPYKVETPVSPVADDVTRAMVESIPAPVPEEQPKKARKPRAAKTEKAPAVKKPRATKKPKAE